MSKQLCWNITSLVLGVLGGMLMLTAIGSTASAGAIIIDGVPEIDPNSIASAVTLFFGSVLLLTGRQKLK